MAISSSSSSPNRKPRVNLKDLKKLIDMMRKAELSEINVEQEGIKIALKRGGEPQVQLVSAPASPVLSAPAQLALPPSSSALPIQAATPPAAEDGLAINSPMVGTFYSSSSPDVEPYVKEGTRVEIGQTVCIIEAMKLMNEIKAESAGVIVKVLVDNAQPVEFGQPLFTIKS
jgi:acetyl-CoA carboxylase biotin carboxyl carrier protein